MCPAATRFPNMCPAASCAPWRPISPISGTSHAPRGDQISPICAPPYVARGDQFFPVCDPPAATKFLRYVPRIMCPAATTFLQYVARLPRRPNFANMCPASNMCPTSCALWRDHIFPICGAVHAPGGDQMFPVCAPPRGDQIFPVCATPLRPTFSSMSRGNHISPTCGTSHAPRGDQIFPICARPLCCDQIFPVCAAPQRPKFSGMCPVSCAPRRPPERLNSCTHFKVYVRVTSWRLMARYRYRNTICL